MPDEDEVLGVDAGDAGGSPSYRLRNVLTQSPEKIKTTVLAVGGVLIALLTDADPSLLETVGVGIAVERLLDLFYVAPVRKAQEEVLAAQVETKALQGIELGRQLARPRVVLQRVEQAETPAEGA